MVGTRSHSCVPTVQRRARSFMAKDNKFGTFGGVYTPSLLTILGVIMYLRLPWVVGQAGLYSALGIILVAHVISICTGLSISSIATDKTVGAGGPYYIVSRSLGLSIGGTLGLALFVGLAVSVSLYVIGFSESFLPTVGIETTPTTIRITGSVVLILVTVVMLISTSFAIKTQYVILALVALSLASVFLGSPAAPPEHTHLEPIANGESLALVFGVFFPAVTGFTAGVNMSGDLRDPRRALPRGTLAAIMTGLVVYVSLAIFVAKNATPEELVSNTEMLQDLAIRPEPVIMGIWGATLSSALGSIMGAPRILQALSVDGITPRTFARGHGKTNEPRNALVLAFLIAEGGILIAELNAIARIVSMVFLTTYGFLNISSAIESWASPDFRPAFRIPRMVSVLGAVTSMVVMIQLDLVAMVGATALMAGLFLYLKRKQLTLEAGDTWEGIWATLVRSGLYRLSQEGKQKRNWRPNIVAFRAASGDAKDPGQAGMAEIAEALVTGSGIVTTFELSESKRALNDIAPQMAPRLGVFTRRLSGEDRYHDIMLLSRYHGFAGLSPNTVLMEHAAVKRAPERLVSLLGELAQMDKNVLVYLENPQLRVGSPQRIDVWWRPEAGNLSLALSLVRFITASDRYHEAEVRFLLLNDDVSSNDHLRTLVRRILVDSRVHATVQVLVDSGIADEFVDRLEKESGDAALVLLGLPNELESPPPDLVAHVEKVAKRVPHALFLGASSAFDEDLGLSRTAPISFLPPAPEDGSRVSLPEIQLPSAPVLRKAVSDLADAHQRLAARFQEHAVQKVYGALVQLMRDASGALGKHFDQLEKSYGSQNPRQQQKLVNRIQSNLLRDCRKLLGDFKDDLEAQQHAVLGQLEAYLEDENLRARHKKQELVVVRDASDFKPSKDDSPYLRRFKRGRRLAAFFRRAGVTYRVPVYGLYEYYREYAANEVLQVALLELFSDTHRALVQLGKVLASGTVLMADLEKDGDAVVQHLKAQKRSVDDRLAELGNHYKTRTSRQQWKLLIGSREVCQAFADDLNRLDVRPLVKRERRASGVVDSMKDQFAEALADWTKNQRLLVERADLGLSIADFQHRLSSIAQKERASILLGLRNGALSECEALAADVRELGARLEAGATSLEGVKVRLEHASRFDPKEAIDALLMETEGTVGDLPETVSTLTDESIRHLEEGALEAVETADLPVRRLFQFLVETRFVDGINQGLNVIPPLEQRLIGVAQDVERLIAFQLSELESGDDQSPEEITGYLKKTVQSGLERLSGEIAELRAACTELSRRFDSELARLAEGGNAYELTETAQELEQHIRLAQGRRAVHGARSLVQREVTRVRDFAVRLLYRESAGRIWARERERGARDETAIVDRVLGFVERHSPRAEVVEALPFYYRQLFFGQATVNENFWVGRSEQMRRVKQALASYRHGTRGAIVVVGERGAGKTAFCQRVAAELLERYKVFRVHAPAGGSPDPEGFRASLRKATGLGGSPSEIFRTLPEQSALLLDDLELWWERSPDGDRVISEIARLIARHSERALFVLGVGRQAFHLMNRLTKLSDRAIAVVECGPMKAEDLKSIMALRHGSTGMTYELEHTREEDLGEIKKARLYSKYFEYSGGYVGAALHAWVSRIERVSGQVLTTSAPRVRDWEVFDGLRVEWVSVLLELFLHKQLTLPRLRRVTELPPQEVEDIIAALCRMKVVQRPRARVYEINPAVSHVLYDRFVQKGLLA